jgi:hypothetical protein
LAVGVKPETRIRPVLSFRWEAARVNGGNFSTSAKRSRTNGRTIASSFYQQEADYICCMSEFCSEDVVLNRDVFGNPWGCKWVRVEQRFSAAIGIVVCLGALAPEVGCGGVVPELPQRLKPSSVTAAAAALKRCSTLNHHRRSCPNYPCRK